MSQFRTTADLVSSVLRRCGENQDETSNYYQQALDYLNQIHHTVITGGNEFNLDVDEPWVWARARRPLILELQPAFVTGTVSLSQGSVTGTFSVPPAYSTEGWFLRSTNGPEVYRIVSHVAGSPTFSIDAAFPQTSAVSPFFCYKLDYDLVGTYMIVDSSNNTLDFLGSGGTAIATLPGGSYLPADLATAVASALLAVDPAGGYTCTYNTVRRLFTITSSSALFAPQGAGANSYRSGWNLLGFDYFNQTAAMTQTSVYPHSTVIRMTQAAHAYYGSQSYDGGVTGEVSGLDPLAMDRDYPLSAAQAGCPDRFSVIREKNDGTLTVRFNKYPTDRRIRIEFMHVPVPRDLQNNAASIPLIPRKFIRILEFGAAFYILTDKRDTKAQSYFQIAQSTLQSMVKFNRKELQKIGNNLGGIFARRDLMPTRRGPGLYGYDKGNY